MKNNYCLVMITFLLLATTLVANAQDKNLRTDQPWQLDVAAGIHSFYAPIKEMRTSKRSIKTMNLMPFT